MKRNITIIKFMCMMLAALAFSQTGVINKHSINVSDSRISPRFLNYQGYLTDTLGNPITNPNISMKFVIFDAPSAGNSKWSEIQNSVGVDKGIFNVQLGKVTPIPDSVFLKSPNRWLELTVAGQLLAPRTQIFSVSYAYTATYSDTAEYARNITGDNDWTRAGRKLYTFYLDDSVGIGNINPRYPLDVNGTICGGIYDTVRAVSGAILSGINNLAGNAANDTAAVVVGGRNNEVSSKFSFIGGGANNIASGSGYTTTTGGLANRADSSYATVGGGAYNTAHGYSSVISGGCYNGIGDSYCTIGGGVQDTVKGAMGSVLGGYRNAAGDSSLDTAAVVAGGMNNNAVGKFSTVGGGINNNVYADQGTIGGGYYNVVAAIFATVSGGDQNVCSSTLAAIGGGFQNFASGQGSTVAGGFYDTSAAAYSFTTNNSSMVPLAYSNSAAFNGMTASAANQTRVGILAKAGGSFTIDHPLDPENKILNHYFVESPEMVLIYRGSVVIGADGKASVHLPDYFDALNKNPMIQLTGVGSYEVCVADEVKGNQFAIAGRPGTKVYWTVTGERKDQSAEVIKIIMPVEQPKEGSLANRSLDDEFLVGTMAQLKRMGRSSGFAFRHLSEQNRYEEMKRTLKEQQN